ncbi:MAG: glycosyltransferase family 9 protein [Mariprofundaceae bacterium]
MKILIVKLSAFGDILHTLPALDDLLNRPEVDEVHWLVDSRYAFVTETFPKQVRVTSVSLKGKHPLKSAWDCIRKLRKEKFDAIIDLQGLIKSGIMARAIGSPVFGFDRNHLPERPNGLFTAPVTFHQDEKHVVQWYRRIAAGPFLEPSNQQPKTPFDYIAPQICLPETVSPQTKRLLSELNLNAGNYIVLNMGGGYPTKRLPDRTWHDTANSILNMGFTPVLVWGSEEEQKRAALIAEHSSDIIVLPHRLETLPLCGFLNESRALISADTGLLHLAAALNVHTVSFWGPTQPDTLGPLGDKDIHVIAPVSCIGCRKRTCNDFICMPKITPEMLLTQLGNRPN